MYYKIEENEQWLTAKAVLLPDGTLLSKTNKTELDGWEWHETPPQEYLDWKEEQENKHITFN